MDFFGERCLVFGGMLGGNDNKERLNAMRAPRGCGAVLKALREAASEMLEWSDCRHEFLLCEIGKVVDMVAPAQGLHAKRLRPAR